MTWYNLELDSHDVILAEGAPAETYLDSGDRETFDNQVIRLPRRGDVSRRPHVAREALSPVPLMVTGAMLSGIRDRLARRAAAFAAPDRVA